MRFTSDVSTLRLCYRLVLPVVPLAFAIRNPFFKFNIKH
jgi:hypothetical protein